MQLSDPSLRPKLAYVITEDWFFASHFLPMARAAIEQGFEVVVITRVRDHADRIAETGGRVISLEAERRKLNPLSLGRTALRLSRILKRERPDLVHCIAAQSIVVGGAAAALAGIDRRIYALTGLGRLGARRDVVGATERTLLRTVVRQGIQSKRTRYLFENPDDSHLLGLHPADPRVTIVGGAGVDPEIFAPSPPPAGSPFRIAIVARMLWSKGIDLAVEAVRQARGRGADVTLSLYGAPDPSNRRAIPVAQLEEWSALDGIVWHGTVRDVRSVWREHHAASLPSRGGEGLPRSLLEAAACGRAILTTDVPGCRSFVRDGIEGRVVPCEADALAEAMVRLAGDRELVERMGNAARERVLSGFTERHVMETVKSLYADLLAR
ncbi:glycosyltransferase family 4 protein [Consotaella aegiceratis]|uniref:glycosyltransferase family 4 protein n=1 Tax=Consotaella aegiceratis TaxID=3097961 RepID=UPI002F3E81FE